MTRYLVFGASGYIGSNLVPFLRNHPVIIRAAARNLEVLRSRHWEGVELVQSDALDSASLEAAPVVHIADADLRAALDGVDLEVPARTTPARAADLSA